MLKASVIMSTYNSEEWLEKVIWGFSIQTETNFEIIIADDGSRDETKQLIDKLREEVSIPIIHVWHHDHGFQKTKILNKAIVASNTEYLIFTDGDCIPRKDFVSVHMRNKEPGYFLSGGYYKLPMSISKMITKENILKQSCFKLRWLYSNGLPIKFKNIKLVNNRTISSIMNIITPTKASWNGHNASGWKKDLLAVNGFNELMKYGGEDRELGERLEHMDIKSKQVRYRAICIHLDHERGYVNEEAKNKNNEIRDYSRLHKIIKTPNGISQADS
ncbi:glycosyltransferase family 2 protein [Flavobacterium sp. '19STA2R22 D10 B1']|uniref:glycosyltransferase family 2 protein n=1 Tax=Flavobacterium aerium TaxID=3037261 RepID=UPI00278C0DB0|nr:glycosyltransferase family 2 protein [Flavobacterium sp. '19STA2R22 D10 B1']